MKSSQELAAAKLGKAVHPKALERLFELAPEAEVRVQHEAIESEIPGLVWLA